MTLADLAIVFGVCLLGGCGIGLALWFFDPTRRRDDEEDRP